MKKAVKDKQIVIRFDTPSYEKICGRAEIEHRKLGEFVRHAVLFYVENVEIKNTIHYPNKKGGAEE